MPYSVFVSITSLIVVHGVLVFVRLKFQNIFKVPVVPKKPEPEKKVPAPALKKAVVPPAKGTCSLAAPWLTRRVIHMGCSAYVLAFSGLPLTFVTVLLVPVLLFCSFPTLCECWPFFCLVFLLYVILEN